MTPRIDLMRVHAGALKGMLALQNQVDSSGLEPQLLHLVKMRASQINGCAYCLDMHSKEARASGEMEQRLYALDAWQETPFYSTRERAALAWTEAVTLVHEGHVPDTVYAQASAEFDEPALINLTLAICAINSWNRLCIAARAVPGNYQPGSVQLLRAQAVR